MQPGCLGLLGAATWGNPRLAPTLANTPTPNPTPSPSPHNTANTYTLTCTVLRPGAAVIMISSVSVGEVFTI